MFDGEYNLTYEEESKIELPGNIYSIIRTLQLVEWAFNLALINKDAYIEQTNNLLDQYKTTTDAYAEKFPGIDDFCRKYGLNDCTLAINRIKKGNVQVSQQNNDLKKIMELTLKFTDVSTAFGLREGVTEPMLVSDIASFISDLCIALRSCNNLLNLEKAEFKKIFQWNEKLRSMKATDQIPEQDEKQMKMDIDYAYNEANASLK